MIKKKLLSIMLVALSAISITANAQQESLLDTLTRNVAGIRSELDVLKRLKISGYVQAQYQVADSGGISSFAGGNFVSPSWNFPLDKRFMVRRGRVKFVYDSPVNEKGIQTSQ